MSDLLARCEVCGGLIDEEDLFCANCGTEAPQRQSNGSHSPPETAVTATHSFECSGCGASMSYDASAQSLRCPFCGSGDLERKTDERTLAANRVVPFRIDRPSALERMRKWLAQGFFRPGDLARSASIETMAAAYVPYWVFAARTHTYWTADTNQLPPLSRGDWRPLFGEHNGQYSGILVGASGALSSQETLTLCPFDLDDAVDPAQIDLENVTVEKFKVGRKYARPIARDGLECLERDACTIQYVPAKARNVQVNTRVEGLASEPILLPVWIMAYRYHERVFRFLINGQTGHATGEAPTSWRRILAVVAVVLGVLVLILALVASQA